MFKPGTSPFPREHCYPMLFREIRPRYGDQISIEFLTHWVFGTPISNGNSVHLLYLKDKETRLLSSPLIGPMFSFLNLIYALYISSFKSPKIALFDKNFVCYYKTSHNVDSQLLYDVRHCVLMQVTGFEPAREYPI